MNIPVQYVGRFAPSPTGDLHFGSLVTAVASYLQARSQDGQWLVRVEDIDPPREVAGSAKRIVDDLARLGMKPDGTILYQSSRTTEYRRIRERLLDSGNAFHCNCTRRTLPAGKPYPGHCRSGPGPGRNKHSTRARISPEVISFMDAVQGEISEDLSNTCGDFVIWRADGLPAYQLAVVLDDALQGVTEVVRGADLLDSTVRQIHLHRLLGLTVPAYAHLPVATLGDGKLSKRDRADPVAAGDPALAVYRSLEFLGQHPPGGLGLDELWAWALKYWSLAKVPPVRSIPLEETDPT